MGDRFDMKVPEVIEMKGQVYDKEKMERRVASCGSPRMAEGSSCGLSFGTERG